MKKVLIAGGTGLVGKSLIDILELHGYQIHLLSRNKHYKLPYTIWDPEKGFIDLTSVPEVDVIINLSGAGIADGYWTRKRKASIINSRVGSNKLIQQIIDKQTKNIECYISASAIGIYGDRAEEVLDEISSTSDTGFLAETVQLWEESVNNIQSKNTRKVIYRFGMVLSKDGGVLKKLLPSMSFCIAPYFGNGRQYFAWIHIKDLSEMILFALENHKIKGVYNAVSPNPVSNKFMINAILKSKKTWAILIPVPSILLKLFLGEMSDLLLSSTRAVPQRITQAGFNFKYEDIEKAMDDLLT